MKKTMSKTTSKTENMSTETARAATTAAEKRQAIGLTYLHLAVRGRGNRATGNTISAVINDIDAAPDMQEWLNAKSVPGLARLGVSVYGAPDWKAAERMYRNITWTLLRDIYSNDQEYWNERLARLAQDRNADLSV